jgi:Ca2+-binding RTX toxin-like protein
MSIFRLPMIIAVLGGLTFVGSAGVALTASNVVPKTSIGADVRVQGVNDVKPALCGAVLSGIVTGSGAVSGTGASELILGSAGADTITGGGGNDCIVAGAGNDSVTAGTGNDVIIGGADTDVCTGGTGTDAFYECETVIP